MRKITKVRHTNIQKIQRKRVAAYARVSSGKDAMINSLSAQISYYNNYIQQRVDWEFVGVYADEAISGTKDGRSEFQRLLIDCRTGKIDMVITKSVTRFARNTVILLETVRELKLLGVDVFFEKENIHSASSDGELMLTFLASYAQEESRSVSENQKWRIRKMFEEGRPSTGRMLGYRLIDGKLCVVTDEAKIVRQIFSDYLSGMGLNAIMKKLNSSDTFSINGCPWSKTALYKIIRNEKYTGDMLLQKTFCSDHISKKMVVNRGELPMYHVIGSHETIIDKPTFECVQREIERRAGKYHSNPSTVTTHLFTSLIRCGICGKNYRRKIAVGSKHSKPVWICATFNTLGKAACPSQQIPESILIEQTAKLVGVTELDRDLLVKNIKEISVPAHNQLVYVLKNGRKEEVAWQNPSRRESWTDEMKLAARERQKKSIEARRKNE